MTLAFFGGVLLALIVLLNGELGRLTTPMWSSLIVHWVGALFAGLFLPWAAKGKPKATRQLSWWHWMGGFIGAWIVALTAITFNTKLGVSGTIAFALLGQSLASLLIDHFGLLAMPVRKIQGNDIWASVLILCGGIVLVMGAK